MMDALNLIRTSIDEDRIVTAEWSADLALDLEVECEGSVETGADLEYWGSLGAGGGWRVHLEGIKT